MRKIHILLLLAAILTAGAVVHLVSDDGTPRNRRAAAENPPSRVATARAAVSRSEPGQTKADVAVVDFRSRRQVLRRGTGPSESRLPDQHATIELELKLEVRRYADGALGMRAIRARATMTAGRERPRDVALAPSLRDEVLLVPGRTRWAERIVFAPHANTTAKQCWQHVVACLQHAYGDERTYTVEEKDDTVGTCSVRYAVESERGAPRLVLVRSKDAHAQDEDRVATLKGSAELEFDSLPIRASGSEQGCVDYAKARQRMEGTLEFTAERLSLRRAVPVERTFFDHTAGEDPHATIRHERADCVQRFTTLRGRLEALAARGERQSDEAYRIIQELVDVFAQSDDAARSVVRESGSDRIVGPVLGALAAAGTPEAQRSILTVLDDPARTKRARFAALYALGNVEKPIPEIDEAVRAAAQEFPEFANTARLILGSVGSRVRDDDSERYERLEQEAVTALESSEGFVEVTTALEVLSNLGPRAVHPRMRASLKSRDPRVRASAVRSLLRVRGDDAQEILESVLQSDSDASVRMAALRMLNERGELGLGTVKASLLRAVADADPDENLRKEALRFAS